MKYNFTRNTKTIKEVYDDFINGKLIVDQTYQRRKVWLPQDKIKLIETILMGFIIPEVFFWPASIDPNTGDRIQHIVDGQQRISCIVDFINNEFSLNSDGLLCDEIKNAYGGMHFSMLPSDIKKHIWTYNLSIVNIDESCEKEIIKTIFYRLNLTNYNLNSQERRKSKESLFGEKSEALSEVDFWQTYRIFSANDVRRMLDVQYCCSIFILAREGIQGETTNKKINSYHDDYKDGFDDDDLLYDKIVKGMKDIEILTDERTKSFISKKVQMFTLFSFIFNAYDKKKEINADIFYRFKLFVNAYNEVNFDLETGIPQDFLELYNLLKQYKLASSEGVNRVGNRQIRLKVLNSICFEIKSEEIVKLFELYKFFVDKKDQNSMRKEQIAMDDYVNVVED